MFLWGLKTGFAIRKQTDMILLEFSKAVDKVAHEKLLQQLHAYGTGRDKNTSYILEQWQKDWDMNLNPAECQVLHVTRLKTPIPSKYFLHIESISAKNTGFHKTVNLSEMIIHVAHELIF